MPLHHKGLKICPCGIIRTHFNIVPNYIKWSLFKRRPELWYWSSILSGCGCCQKIRQIGIFWKFDPLWRPLSPSSRGVRGSDYVRSKALRRWEIESAVRVAAISSRPSGRENVLRFTLIFRLDLLWFVSFCLLFLVAFTKLASQVFSLLGSRRKFQFTGYASHL